MKNKSPFILHFTHLFVPLQHKNHIMDVAFLLDKYFKEKENISIDVFDA